MWIALLNDLRMFAVNGMIHNIKGAKCPHHGEGERKHGLS